jgi:hypothetical protein
LQSKPRRNDGKSCRIVRFWRGAAQSVYKVAIV